MRWPGITSWNLAEVLGLKGLQRGYLPLPLHLKAEVLIYISTL